MNVFIIFAIDGDVSIAIETKKVISKKECRLISSGRRNDSVPLYETVEARIGGDRKSVV